jgi:hypothetical protein
MTRTARTDGVSPVEVISMKSLYEQLASSNVMTACNLLNKSIKDSGGFFSSEQQKHLFDSIICMIESVSGSHVHHGPLVGSWDSVKEVISRVAGSDAPPIEVDMALECVEEAVQVLLVAHSTT